MNWITAKNPNQHGILPQSGPCLGSMATANTPRHASTLVGNLYRRSLRALKRRLACLTFGHEKWTVSCGDWACMRCGRVKYAQIPPLPADPTGLRAALKSLERDQNELKEILRLLDS